MSQVRKNIFLTAQHLSGQKNIFSDLWHLCAHIFLQSPPLATDEHFENKTVISKISKTTRLPVKDFKKSSPQANFLHQMCVRYLENDFCPLNTSLHFTSSSSLGYFFFELFVWRVSWLRKDFFGKLCCLMILPPSIFFLWSTKPCCLMILPPSLFYVCSTKPCFLMILPPLFFFMCSTKPCCLVILPPSLFFYQAISEPVWHLRRQETLFHFFYMS